MSRDLGTDLTTEINKEVLYPFVALYIGLDDPVIVWNGTGTLTAAGREWEGIGGLVGLSAAGESSDGSAIGMEASVSGIPERYRDDIADQAQRGAAFEVWVGALNADFITVAAEPVLVWKGKVDGYDITDSGTEIGVTVRGESSNRDQGRPRIKRYSDAEQRRRFAGDKFFEWLPQMAEVKILWSKGDVSGVNISGGPTSPMGGFAFRGR